MRAAMHNLLAKKSPFREYPTKESIEGWLSFLKSVEKDAHDQMKKYWDQQQRRWAINEKGGGENIVVPPMPDLE